MYKKEDFDIFNRKRIIMNAIAIIVSILRRTQGSRNQHKSLQGKIREISIEILRTEKHVLDSISSFEILEQLEMAAKYRNDEILNLTNSKVSLMGDLNSIRKERQTLKLPSQQLWQKNSELSKQNLQLREELQKQKKVHEVLTQQFQKLRTWTEKLQRKINEQDKELSHSHDLLQQKQTQRQKMESEINHYTDRVIDLEKNNNNYLNATQNTNKKMLELTAQRKEEKKQLQLLLQRKEEERLKSQRELEKKVNQWKEANQEIDMMKSYESSLREEIQQLEEEITSLKLKTQKKQSVKVKAKVKVKNALYLGQEKALVDFDLGDIYEASSLLLRERHNQELEDLNSMFLREKRRCGELQKTCELLSNLQGSKIQVQQLREAVKTFQSELNEYRIKCYSESWFSFSQPEQFDAGNSSTILNSNLLKSNH